MYPGLPSRLDRELKQLYLERVLKGNTDAFQVGYMLMFHELLIPYRNSNYASRHSHAVNTWCIWVVRCWQI
jgi:hypothetical protein